MELGRAVFVAVLAAVRSNAPLGASAVERIRATPFLSLFSLSR